MPSETEGAVTLSKESNENGMDCQERSSLNLLENGANEFSEDDIVLNDNQAFCNRNNENSNDNDVQLLTNSLITENGHERNSDEVDSSIANPKISKESLENSTRIEDNSNPEEEDNPSTSATEVNDFSSEENHRVEESSKSCSGVVPKAKKSNRSTPYKLPCAVTLFDVDDVESSDEASARLGGSEADVDWSVPTCSSMSESTRSMPSTSEKHSVLEMGSLAEAQDIDVPGNSRDSNDDSNSDTESQVERCGKSGKVKIHRILQLGIS